MARKPSIGRRLAFAIVPPVLATAGAIGHTSFQESRARDGLVPVESLRWALAGEPVVVHAVRTLDGELERYAFAIEAEGRDPHRLDFEIDHDLFGGGFVGGLDVDADGDLELVLATRHGRTRSRVVEPAHGRITDRAFDTLPDAYWDDVKVRLDRVAPSGLAMLAVGGGLLWLVVAVAANLLGAIWWMIGRATGRGRHS